MKDKNKLRSLFIVKDLDVMLEVYRRAIEHGKRPGGDCQEEFEELLKERPDAFEYLGNTTKDIDLLTGDLREEGLKILNVKEEQGRIDREKDNKTD